MPYWFRNWWDIHGPSIELLPIELSQTLTYFVSKYKIKPEEQFFPNLLIFISKYKIPWILKWSYGINPNTRILTRIYSVKWWDKFQISRVMGYVYKEFPMAPTPVNQKPSSSGVSHASLQLEGKSSSELKALAKEILAQASHLDQEDAKSTSSQGSSSNQAQPPSQKKNDSPARKAWADYEDSQDPYEVYDLSDL
jgi:hypothetical protein